MALPRAKSEQPWIRAAGLALVALSATLCFWELQRLRGQVARLKLAITQVAAQVTPAEEGSMVTSYVSGGEIITVTTDRESGESNEDWAERHKQEILERMETDPPD